MIIFLLLAAALIIRLINLNQSLWLDEAINVVYSQKYNFTDFITVYSLGDFHPPLHFALIWVWTRIFGISEIAVRLPSVIFGVLAVWFTYLTGRNLFNKKTGFLAALFLAVNPLHVFYSQEARMYSLAAFSVTFSFWAFGNLLKGKKLSFFFYVLSIVMILYSDYLVYLVLPVQLLYVVWVQRKNFAQVLLGMVLGGIFWMPWLLIFPSQIKTGQGAAIQIPGWANVVGGANFKDLLLVWVKLIIGRVSFENKFIYASVLFFASAVYGFTLFRAVRPLSKEVRLLLLWVIIPVIFAFLISFYIPVLAYFRMIFIIPAISILLGYGIEKFSKRVGNIFLGLILIISLIFLLNYYLLPQFQRENWKEAISFANKSGEFVLFEDVNIPAPAQYYLCSDKCAGALKNFPANSEADIKSFEGISGERVLLFNYLVDISDPYRLVQKKLENSGYKNTQTWDFNGVGFVYEYSK